MWSAHSALAGMMIVAVLVLGSSMLSKAASQAMPDLRALHRAVQQTKHETATVHSLVSAAIAGDQVRLGKVVAQLRALPKPPRGDRSRARQLNERGLALWQRQRFAEAAAVFKQAYQADGSDAEIAENLGYALLRSGDVAAAEPAILAALELGPERASAWGSLGTVYAKHGKHQEAVACVLTGYSFAPDRKRALDVYSRLASNDPDPRVRAMFSEVVRRISKAY